MVDAPTTRIIVTLLYAGVSTEFLILGLATLRSAFRETKSLGIFRPTWAHQVGTALTTTGTIFLSQGWASAHSKKPPVDSLLILFPILFILLMRPLITWLSKGWGDAKNTSPIQPLENLAREEAQKTQRQN